MHKQMTLSLGACLLAGALASPALCAAAEGDVSIDVRLARQYFGEAKQACERDGGALWGRSLCGPLLVVDPANRDLVANQADGENRLVRDGSLFRGRVEATTKVGASRDT